MSNSRSGSAKKESESPPLGLSPKDTDIKTEELLYPTLPFEGKSETPTVEGSATPPVAQDVKPVRKGPQLIGDLPVAQEEALSTFVELQGNHYQYNTLGRSREALESMTCDCQYEHGQYTSISTTCGAFLLAFLHVFVDPLPTLVLLFCMYRCR